MASNRAGILWTGTVSEKYKKGSFKILSLFFVFAIVSFLNFILLCWDFIFMALIFLFLLIMFLIIMIRYFLSHFFNKYPQYQLTPEALVYKDWTFFGRVQIKTLNLSDLKQFYFEAGIIYFFTKKFDDWGGEYSKRLEQAIFCFWQVDSLEQLIEVLQSMIPFKKHPTLEDMYQRIE